MNPRVWESGASATPPTAPSTPSTGYPTAGDPALGVQPTKGGAYWFYQVGESLRNVITRAGLTPSHTNLNLLGDAIIALIASSMASIATSAGFAASIAPNGYIKLPSWLGGWICQWGVDSTNTTSPVGVVFPVPFPSACNVILATPNIYAAATGYLSVYNKSLNGFDLIKSGNSWGSYWISLGN